jgi:hypothetical protein
MIILTLPLNQLQSHLRSERRNGCHLSLEEIGGLYFTENLFSFMLTREEGDDDDLKFEDEEELIYHLTGFMKRNEILPDFDNCLPDDPQQLVVYYNELLAVQYLFLVNFKKITTPIYLSLPATMSCKTDFVCLIACTKVPPSTQSLFTFRKSANVLPLFTSTSQLSFLFFILLTL